MLRILVVVSFAVSLTGCTVMQETGAATRETMKLFKPNPHDPITPGDVPVEDWVDSAGVEARGDRPLETSDPLDKWLLSPKAQSISRNTGFSH